MTHHQLQQGAEVTGRGRHLLATRLLLLVLGSTKAPAAAAAVPLGMAAAAVAEGKDNPAAAAPDMAAAAGAEGKDNPAAAAAAVGSLSVLGETQLLLLLLLLLVLKDPAPPPVARQEAAVAAQHLLLCLPHLLLHLWKHLQSQLQLCCLVPANWLLVLSTPARLLTRLLLLPAVPQLLL
jgi:hypothetical protein